MLELIIQVIFINDNDPNLARRETYKYIQEYDTLEECNKKAHIEMSNYLENGIGELVGLSFVCQHKKNVDNKLLGDPPYIQAKEIIYEWF